MNDYKMIKLVSVIAAREMEDKVIDAIAKKGGNFVHSVLAKGTATREILNLIGLGSTEKVLLLFSVEEDKIEDVYGVLREEFSFGVKPGKGVAFSIPLTAVGGPVSYRILSGKVEMEEKL